MAAAQSQEWREKDGLLGSGGFGIVRLFYNKNGEQLVVKECRPKNMTEKNKERWRTECEIMVKLDHPNIVKSVQLPDELKNRDDFIKPLLPMEYCNSGDLRKVLNMPQNMYGLEEFQVRAVIHDISSAVQYLHDLRIYHRDLKPENIVLHQLTRQRVVYKIIDLGYAKEVSQDSICTSFVGTIQYLAPELLSNTKPECTRTVDFWSLGTTVFECISGFRPFAHFTDMFQWLQVVRAKSDRDIYAFVNSPSQQPTFYECLPKTNKLSSASQCYYEAWLRLMLTSDPKTRGGQRQGNVPQCYSRLQELFHHKPLHVYDPLTNESHFFDVVKNESLFQIGHLHGLFPKIPKATFVTTIGSVPEDKSKLVDFCTPVNYESEQELDEIDINLILVYQAPELPEKKKLRGARLDQLMSGRLATSNNAMELLKMCKQLTHYCWTLYRSFQHLRKAKEGIKLCLVRADEKLVEDVASLRDASKKLHSKVELFSKSLEVDISELMKYVIDENARGLLESWKMHENRIKEWKDLVTQEESMTMKCNSTQYKIKEYFRKPHAEHIDKEGKMKSHYKYAQEMVEQLREYINLLNNAGHPDRNPDNRNYQAEAKNCLLDCEKDWEQYFKENKFQIKNNIALYKEAMNFVVSITDMKTKFLSSCDELTIVQSTRQKEIWRIVLSQEFQSLTPSSTQSLDVMELCDKSRLLIERVNCILSENIPRMNFTPDDSL